MLNPPAISQLSSPPLSPQQEQAEYYHHSNKRNSTSSMSSTSSSGSGSSCNNGKPRSRFSNVEDAIICEGVARGLTWGQISGQLPHRKRATCFNRYRTLQGIRKSRKRFSCSSMQDMRSPPITPPCSSSTSSWSTPSPKEQHRSHHSYHSYHHYNNSSSQQQQQLPVLVAPLPTRITLPYTYADRIH
jgi:hypothetical protein